MSTLKRKSAIALAWDFGGLIINRGSGFIISIFLARLLSPEEFGLVGMSMVFIGVSQVFVDVGFTAALIQRNKNTNLAYSSVFYFNIVSGLILTVVFYFIAPYIGSFYDSAHITAIVRWLSLSFIFNSLNQVQSAILTKELNFKVLTIRNVIASILGGILGVISAFQGMGVYALVVQTVSQALLRTILLWSINSWRPSFLFSFLELKALMGFSIYRFLDALASSVFGRLDVLFVGKIFSPATLGYYTRADSLNTQVATYTSSSISKVFFPVLSKLKDNLEKFNNVYFKLVSVICFVSFILSGFLYVWAEPLIIGLFGEKWMFSVLIFQILVFKSFNVPLNVIMLNAFISRGFAKESLKIGLVRKLIRTVPLFVGLIYGLFPFIWAVVIISYLLTFYNILYMKKYLELGVSYHLKRVFEGILPFIILVIVRHLNNFNNTELFFVSFFYLVSYIVYASIIKMEGFSFILNEFKKNLKKWKESFY